VSLATGNVFFDQEDATVAGVGTAVRFVRSYNSDNRGNASTAFSDAAGTTATSDGSPLLR
jgi:hypothetical protein